MMLTATLMTVTDQYTGDEETIGRLWLPSFEFSGTCWAGASRARVCVQLHSQSDWNVTNAFSNFSFNSCG